MFQPGGTKIPPSNTNFPPIQPDRSKMNPTPLVPDIDDVRKIKIGHSQFGKGQMSDVTEPTLVNRNQVCNLFFSTNDYAQEESMRDYATPIHEDHSFKQLLRTLGLLVLRSKFWVHLSNTVEKCIKMQNF